MPYLGTFRPKFEETVVILKSATSNLSKCKGFMLKKKNWIWDQKYFIWVFLDYNLKKAFVILEISSFKIFKNKFLTILVNFGIGSAFSKGPGPGLGPLFKVPQNIGRNKIRFGQWRSRVKLHWRILMNVNEIYCNQSILLCSIRAVGSFFMVEGGGGVSENGGHHGWPRTKKNWLKHPKAVRQKTKLGPKYKWFISHICNSFFENIFSGVQL